MTEIENAATPLDVRVPLLGGYVLNKSLTFQKRLDHMDGVVRTPNIKRGKDLVYIRDVLAGGPAVATAVETDLSMMAKAAGHAASRMTSGAANLSRVVRDRPPETWDEAVRLLEEREGLGAMVMAQDLAGHLSDAAEILVSSAANR